MASIPPNLHHQHRAPSRLYRHPSNWDFLAHKVLVSAGGWNMSASFLWRHCATNLEAGSCNLHNSCRGCPSEVKVGPNYLTSDGNSSRLIEPVLRSASAIKLATSQGDGGAKRSKLTSTNCFFGEEVSSRWSSDLHSRIKHARPDHKQDLLVSFFFWKKKLGDSCLSFI